MTAPARRKSAAALLDHWHQAADIRREWLEVGSSTEPSNRQAAEAVLTRLYARHGRGRPEFRWVASPREGLPYATAIPSHEDLHRWRQPRQPAGRPPLAVDLAAGWSAMMAALDDCAEYPGVKAPKKETREWPVLPPAQALEFGVPLRVVLRREVRDHLWTKLMQEQALPVRSQLGPPARLPICWYGRHDASWIAHYDVLRRLGLAAYPPRHAARLDDWALLARSTGWWWPDEHHCVMVERATPVT
ncbi:hypothetical protein [Actinoplanes sp. TFC3]|uniref:hypothetical protein n=1 Tax=Actinoplanes sp. TFC3 TaxID=1710355 RepID=UPI000831154D|nr:hypothetical protein [Actinoplanes sp. TFC3]